MMSGIWCLLKFQRAAKPPMSLFKQFAGLYTQGFLSQQVWGEAWELVLVSSLVTEVQLYLGTTLEKLCQESTQE